MVQRESLLGAVRKRRYDGALYGAAMARPRKFDEQALLDAATELFWSQGYDETSVDDVSTASGVGNGSIYAAYGSKQGLFLAVFERYCDRRAAFVEGVMDASYDSAREAARAFFDAIIVDCSTQPGRRGCLMINSMASLGPKVPEVAAAGRRSTARMEQSLTDRLSEVLERSGDELATVSANLVLVSQGLIQLSRQGVPRERLDEIAAVSFDALPDAA